MRIILSVSIPGDNISQASCSGYFVNTDSYIPFQRKAAQFPMSPYSCDFRLPTKSCGTRCSDLKSVSSELGTSERSKSQRKQMSSKIFGLVLIKFDNVTALSELRRMTAATVITSSLPILPLLLIEKINEYLV